MTWDSLGSSIFSTTLLFTFQHCIYLKYTFLKSHGHWSWAKRFERVSLGGLEGRDEMSMSSSSLCSIYSIIQCCATLPYNVMIVACAFLLLFVLELNLQSFAKMKIYVSLRYISLRGGRQAPCLAYRLYNRYSPNCFFVFAFSTSQTQGQCDPSLDLHQTEPGRI